MQSAPRIGILGGTFDPIHKGHLAIALNLLDNDLLRLESIWLTPTYQNPLKENGPFFTFDERCDIILNSIEQYPKLKCCTVEREMPLHVPHYTFDTLQHLSMRHPDAQFVLLIGADNWLHFHKWYKADEIIARYPIIIYPRPGYPISSPLPKSVFYAEDVPQTDLSSTEIRNYLLQKDTAQIEQFMPSEHAFAALLKAMKAKA